MLLVCSYKMYFVRETWAYPDDDFRNLKKKKLKILLPCHESEMKGFDEVKS